MRPMTIMAGKGHVFSSAESQWGGGWIWRRQDNFYVIETNKNFNKIRDHKGEVVFLLLTNQWIKQQSFKRTGLTIQYTTNNALPLDLYCWVRRAYWILNYIIHISRSSSGTKGAALFHPSKILWHRRRYLIRIKYDYYSEKKLKTQCHKYRTIIHSFTLLI